VENQPLEPPVPCVDRAPHLHLPWIEKENRRHHAPRIAKSDRWRRQQARSGIVHIARYVDNGGSVEYIRLGIHRPQPWLRENHFAWCTIRPRWRRSGI